MKKGLAVLLGLVVAAAISGWSQHSDIAAAVAQGCVATDSGDAAQCDCIGQTVSGELSFVSFAGLGPIRPLMQDKVQMQSLVLDAMSTCVAA